jgi:hypothetical protein
MISLLAEMTYFPHFRTLVFRHCEERRDEAIQNLFLSKAGLLRGACRRAALRADRLARNDGSNLKT